MPFCRLERKWNNELARISRPAFQALMHMDRDRLVRLALAALDELIEQAKAAPIQPTVAIRVTLATAYAFSDGNREPFDGFWKEMQNPWAGEADAAKSAYCRQTYMRASLRGIIRAVGMPETPEMDWAIERLWRGRGRGC